MRVITESNCTYVVCVHVCLLLLFMSLFFSAVILLGSHPLSLCHKLLLHLHFLCISQSLCTSILITFLLYVIIRMLIVLIFSYCNHYAVAFTKQHVFSPSSVTNPFLRNIGCYTFRPLLRAMYRQKNTIRKTLSMYAAKFISFVSVQIYISIVKPAMRSVEE